MARVSLDELMARRPALDHAKIEATTEEDIRRQMLEDGEDPDARVDPADWTEVLPPREVRMRLGMTQADLAAALRIPAPTLESWEQGRTTPDPAAQALFRILGREPAAALRALGVKPPRRAGSGKR